MNHHADVAVIGGGSAGSLAAAMLGRAGVSAILVDIHESYPEEFRCEKIHDDQVDLFRATGLGEGVLSAATPIPEMWEARHGWLTGKMRRVGKPWEYGIAYEDLANSIRRQIPDSVAFICAKATGLTTSEDKQTVVLSNGDTLTARLVILATGLSNRLVDEQGIPQTEISKCHSISVGFDIAAKTGFKFPALTYFAERAGPSGYVSIFPIGSRMRINWFLYHGFSDSWVRLVREKPLPLLLGIMPRLKPYLDGVEVVGPIRMRPIDLNIVTDYLRPGLVLVGDTFCNSCPSAGTGLNKVLTDVPRLCHYIPEWLATSGMGIEKIKKFYDDPIKTACDAWSMRKAFYQRSLAVDRSLIWRFRRVGWIAFSYMLHLRTWRERRSTPVSPKVTAELQPRLH